MSLYGRILPIQAITKDQDLLGVLISSLPFGKEEQRRLSNIRNEAALRESLGVWLALWDLAQILSIPLPESVLRTPQGKPYFESPALPSFSLSHTDSFAVAVVSTEGPVGVDVEGLARKDSFSRIADRYFSDSEKALLHASNTPCEHFLRIWTQKEATAKMTGEGLASILGKSPDAQAESIQSCKIQRANQVAYLSIATTKPTDPIKWVNLQKEITVLS